MSIIFFLLKFFREAKYAADFVDGKLFCNTLSAFKKMEAAITLVVLIGMKARPFGYSQAK